MKGIDCATPLTEVTAAEFKADGYGFVGRYTVSEGSWKALTAVEAKIISDAGLYIVSVYETSADRALDGENAGIYDGQTAANIAIGLGQPAGTPIYMAVDFDAVGSQYGVVEAYLRAAKIGLEAAGYQLGVYGSYSVVEVMHGRGVCTYLWQTLAWSHGQRSANAQLYQSDIDKMENGIGVDYNESNGNAGGWKIQPPAAPTLDLELANSIIVDLGEAWKVTKSDDVKNKLHDIANAVRKLAGLEVTND